MNKIKITEDKILVNRIHYIHVWHYQTTNKINKNNFKIMWICFLEKNVEISHLCRFGLASKQLLSEKLTRMGTSFLVYSAAHAEEHPGSAFFIDKFYLNIPLIQWYVIFTGHYPTDVLFFFSFALNLTHTFTYIERFKSIPDRNF